MNRRTVRKLNSDKVGMPLASMIDIVFLLIIFFVITAEIDKEVQDEYINLAAAPHGKPAKIKLSQNVTLNIRSDGKTLINGTLIQPAELRYFLKQSAMHYDNKVCVVIRADRDVTHEFVKKAITAIREAGIDQLKFNAEIK